MLFFAVMSSATALLSRGSNYIIVTHLTNGSLLALQTNLLLCSTRCNRMSELTTEWNKTSSLFVFSSCYLLRNAYTPWLAAALTHSKILDIVPVTVRSILCIVSLSHKLRTENRHGSFFWHLSDSKLSIHCVAGEKNHEVSCVSSHHLWI